MNVPILAYHAYNIVGNDYFNNDHVAFAHDLELITSQGWQIAPLHEIIDVFLADRISLPKKTIAITFDDGTDFDFYDLLHPTAGMQRSMLNIMSDFAKSNPGAQPKLHATSFVIASPDARNAMAKKNIFGNNWMRDSWWLEAVDSGRLGIGNHSWDHVSNAVSYVAQRNQEKGNFFCIDTLSDAIAQIYVAAEFIESIAPNPSTKLFAYPYGHVNKYLPEVFLPNQAADRNGMVKAAFGTKDLPLMGDSDRWNIPRYVCGWHWKSQSELRAILNQCEAG